VGVGIGVGSGVGVGAGVGVVDMRPEVATDGSEATQDVTAQSRQRKRTEGIRSFFIIEFCYLPRGGTSVKSLSHISPRVQYVCPYTIIVTCLVT